MIEVGSDFSGVGAFEQALSRLNIKHNTIFACDKDKYARITYKANYGNPKYFPEDVYERIIPEKPLDIYVSSPPCQSFSLAGKRKGEDDKRGILFYNTHEFIKVNKPRYFIIENVKGLLSDSDGNTFNKWITMLSGKSTNGVPILFPHEESAPYHVYWEVLNSKHYGVPQNRERVFIVGIRDDSDNNFTWPKEIPLTKRLKDVLENDVDEKYYLSEKMLELITYNGKSKGIIADLNKGGQKGLIFSDTSDYMNCLTSTDYKQPKQIQVKSATKKGCEVATESDSINLSNLSSETRRGRVGKEVAQTLDTSCNQAVLVAHVGRSDEGKRLRKESMAKGKDFTPFQAKKVEFKPSDIMNCITTATTKDNLIIDHRGHINKPPNVITNGIIPTLRAESHGHQPKVFTGFNIRRLTPRECFRLMDFPDTFTWPVSNSQAYKQAGNSIVVAVLASIIDKLNL